MARKGKTGKEPLRLDKLGDVLGSMQRVLKDERLGLTADEAKIADGLAAVSDWEAENKSFTAEELNAAAARIEAREDPNAPLCAVVTPDVLAKILDEGNALTPEDRAWAREVLGVAPTTVCNEHVPSEECPLYCAKCGKPLRTPRDITPLCEVISPEATAAVFAEIEANARQSEKRFEKAADDGPVYERPAPGAMVLPSLWAMRLDVLAKEEKMTPVDYVEGLIRRQWVARGGGKRG